MQALIAIAAAVTTLAGALISLDYHNRLIRVVWPEGWAKLEQLFTRIGF